MFLFFPRVEQLLKQRSHQAQAVGDVYMQAAEFLRINEDSHIFQVRQEQVNEDSYKYQVRQEQVNEDSYKYQARQEQVNEDLYKYQVRQE